MGKKSDGRSDRWEPGLGRSQPGDDQMGGNGVLGSNQAGDNHTGRNGGLGCPLCWGEGVSGGKLGCLSMGAREYRAGPGWADGVRNVVAGEESRCAGLRAGPVALPSFCSWALGGLRMWGICLSSVSCQCHGWGTRSKKKLALHLCCFHPIFLV